MSTLLLPLLCLLIGLALGAALAALLQRGRLGGERAAGRAEAEAELRPQLSALNERLMARTGELERVNEQMAAQGGDLASLREQSNQLGAQIASLNTLLEQERKSAQEKLDAFKQAEQTFRESFASLAGQALKDNNESFVHLARRVLAEQQQEASNELGKKQTAVDELLKPIRETLTKLEAGTRDIETRREGAYQSVLTEIRNMQETHKDLRKETGQLVSALRAPKVRGNWGELQLRNCVEYAGMLQYASFDVEVFVRAGDAQLRPDMVVKLPNSRTIVVDAKTPLDAFLNSHAATDEASRTLLLKAHAAQVRSHLNQLSSKGYAKQFKDSPDFVICFLPSEVLFSAALEQDPGLIEHGAMANVLLATPTTLIALLKAVSYGWQQMEISRDAQAIRDTAVSLYDKLVSAQKSFTAVGKGIRNAADAWEDMRTQVEGRGGVFSQGRKLNKLGIGDKEMLATSEIALDMKELQAEDWRVEQPLPALSEPAQ